MRLRLPLLALLLACPVGAVLRAQAIAGGSATGYSSGDLLLAFYGDASASDTIFDLGSLASFKNAAAGTTFTLANFNNVAAVTSNTGAFGATVDWTVAGGNGSTGELVVASAGGSLKSSPTYTTLASALDNIGYEVAGNAATGSTFAVLTDQPVYNQIGVNASHEWTNGPSNRADATTSGTTTLTLWDLDSGVNNTGAAVDLGTLTLDAPDDRLTFTAAGTAPGGTTTAPSGSAHLVNISTRAQVGTGANVLIPGFVIAGTGAETVLIRAAGPGLAQFGLTGLLAAPSLTVFDHTGMAMATNTGWGTSADAALIASTAQAVGAFAFTTGSADCAVVIMLAPGSYTVEISGVNSTTGVALAEVYEVSSTGTTLSNLSTRAQVGTGADEEIAGFVIAGSGAETLLTRADGPSLAPFGITDFLAAPVLVIETASQQTVASNTGWGTNTSPNAVAAAAVTVGAFPLTSGSADSATAVSLPAGNYTMQVSGAGGTTGVALAEVYADSAN